MKSSFVLREKYSEAWLDQIIAVHNKTEMKRDPSFKEMMNKAFAASFAFASVWDGDRLVAFGRMISDGYMYSAIFDVVVDPDYQKKGLGKQVMQSLMSKVPDSRFMLTSTFGNEEFYKKLGFKHHKTGMAMYPGGNNSPYLVPE
jgi:ribosomal protein S18 acetylase RimI-like enzyme